MKPPVDASAVDPDALLVVRNASAAHRTLWAALHAYHVGRRVGDKLVLAQGDLAGECVQCQQLATGVLEDIVQPTVAEYERERFPPRLDLGPPWVLEKAPADAKTEVWDNRRRNWRVIRSVGVQADGREWMHVSMSRRDRKLPSWEDLAEVKDIFVGDVEAYIVLPPRARYVNEHPGVLHLWSCLDAPGGVLPDFTMGTNSV